MKHYFNIKAVDTKLVGKDAGGITRIDVRAANWILGPAIDIRAIGDTYRPDSSLSQLPYVRFF